MIENRSTRGYPVSKNAARTAVIAAAALVAGTVIAVSCTGGGGGKSVSGICRASCNQLEECDGEYFDDWYDDAEDCEDQCQENLNAYIDEYSECGSEIKDQEECMNTLSCDEFEDWDYGVCEDESNDLADCMAESYGQECTTENAQVCFDDFTACTEEIDVESPTYMDEYQACLADYCDCLENLGCDMTGIDCGGSEAGI
jgi:hypothetical protein